MGHIVHYRYGLSFLLYLIVRFCPCGGGCGQLQYDYLLGGGDGRFVQTLEPYSPERSTFQLLLNPTSGPNFKGQSNVCVCMGGVGGVSVCVCVLSSLAHPVLSMSRVYRGTRDCRDCQKTYMRPSVKEVHSSEGTSLQPDLNTTLQTMHSCVCASIERICAYVCVCVLCVCVHVSLKLISLLSYDGTLCHQSNSSSTHKW